VGLQRNQFGKNVGSGDGGVGRLERQWFDERRALDVRQRVRVAHAIMIDELVVLFHVVVPGRKTTRDARGRGVGVGSQHKQVIKWNG